MYKIVLLALSVLTMTLIFNQSSQPSWIGNYEQWKIKYNKQFTGIEDAYRLEVYKSNLVKINLHNANPSRTYQMSENKFMGLTNDEFVGIYLMKVDSPQIAQTEQNEIVDYTNLEASDWRGTSKVKDQGQCASGWAFSVTGTMEAYQYLKSGRATIIDVSEQQLLDCEVYSFGCEGGNTLTSLQYVVAFGLQSSQNYPYMEYQQICRYKGGEYKLQSYKAIGGVTQIVDALKSRPVSVGLDATNFQFYQYGIFKDCQYLKTPNHYALLEGNQSDGIWIVKNSWGLDWGEYGYIKIAGGDTCGITQNAYSIA